MQDVAKKLKEELDKYFHLSGHHGRYTIGLGGNIFYIYFQDNRLLGQFLASHLNQPFHGYSVVARRIGKIITYSE